MSIQDDMILMKDGRVMIVRNDGMKPLEDEMTLSDGTRVGMDGTARMMEEGETIDLTGEPTHAEQMNDRQFKENMEDEELRDDIQ